VAAVKTLAALIVFASSQPIGAATAAPSRARVEYGAIAVEPRSLRR
jgi:hypothetical protein